MKLGTRPEKKHVKIVEHCAQTQSIYYLKMQILSQYIEHSKYSSIKGNELVYIELYLSARTHILQ